jgi:hypothetical protein
MGKIKIAEDKRNVEGEYFTKFYQSCIEAELMLKTNFIFG